MEPRVFRYVVANDGGVAPQPFDGYCTLAVCKPQIRKAAQVGDWVIGFRGRMAGHVTYVMQVEEVIPIAKYWSDRRFANRRPGRTRTPDNFYRLQPDGQFEQVPNEVHGPSELRKDTGGRNVLVSKRFWYFGNASPRIAPELSHLIQRHRGHAVQINRRGDDLERLQLWLSRWPTGVHGSPVDRELVDHPLELRRCVESTAARRVKSERC
jgi:hypothetical protein